MKYLLLTISLLVSFSVFSTAQAARPCQPIVKACILAGVIQSSASRQVMFENCVKPIISGNSLSGVQVDSSVINACKARVSSRM